MTESVDTRVAVYIDFDNIVISRYDQLHGRNSFQRDKARGFDSDSKTSDNGVAERLAQATVDVGAIIDFASSFGTLVLTRAYADWSASINADYRGQLVSRAVDLVQLFPTAAYTKNGADIRLAVDAVEDMFRLPDLTHVVVVAGDSDYIALAQRCKRLGRYVVGIGVAGSTSKSLAAACDEFATYDALPGITLAPPHTLATARNGRSIKGADATAAAAGGAAPTPETPETPGVTTSARKGVPEISFDPGVPVVSAPVAAKKTTKRTKPATRGAEEEPEPEADANDPQELATHLLERALRLGHEKDDADWLHNSAVKTQMKRMDPSFSEKALGYRSFSDFVKSRDEIAELDESSTIQLMRLRP
jgi:uncharacterized LabA/DUF88 family protein